MFAGEQFQVAAEPVDQRLVLVHLHLDAVGCYVLDGVGDGVLVHLLADAHVVEGLQQQVHHGLAGQVFAVDDPCRVGLARQGHLVVLLVGEEDVGDGGGVLDVVVLA